MDSRTALALVLGLLVGAGAAWLLNPTAGGDAAGERLEADAPGDPARGPALGTEATELRARLDAATTDLQEARQRAAQDASDLATLREEVERLREAAAKGTAPGTPSVGKGVRFPYDGFTQTLKDIDWDVAGDAVAHMSPLLSELARALAEGRPIPPSVGDIQRYNGPLVKIALTAQQGGMPGTGVNGAFTHPSILANLVYATLVKAGLPLDEAQEKRLEQVADEFVREDQRRLAGYQETTLALQKLIEEAALKDRFYAAVDALVSDEQREVLHPQAVRGRLSFDLFSSGIVWAPVVAPQRYATPEQLAASLVSQVVARFEVTAEQRGVVEEMIGEWAKGFPPGYLDAPADALSLGGHMKIDHVRAAAERQLVLYRALLDRLPADAPAVGHLRSEPYVAVPLRTP